MDAIRADIHHHRVTADRIGLDTLARHTNLIGHLAARLSTDTAHQVEADSDDLPSVERFTEAADALGKAVALYTAALAPLVALTQPDPDMPSQLSRNRLNGQLKAAERALVDASTALTAPRPAFMYADPPKLSRAQYDALSLLAAGGGNRYMGLRPGGLSTIKVFTRGGTRIATPTFDALLKHGLVVIDTTTALTRGQQITVTAPGRHALTQPRPAPRTPPACRPVPVRHARR